MHNHYSDILDKVDGQLPEWFDENGVPRFCDFTPKRLANIYADSCCLLTIGCQGCGRAFHVAMSDSASQQAMQQHWLNRPWRRLAELVRNGNIHYGDPPNMGCCPAGPTMNSIPRRVLEFWLRDKFDWERCAELEIDIHCGWAEDDEDDEDDD